jgi:hypothetical protein
MALTLKEIQAKLLAQQANKDRAKNGGSFGGDNAVYPFWNNPDNTVATLRLLPDGDENNDFFWLERLIIKLPFPGVKGQNDGKPVEVQVPCTDMWKAGSCPINAEIRPWWKDKSLEDMARKYYRKKSFLFQGFVTDNPNQQDQTPENPIRRFIINPSIFECIKKILMVQEIEHSPVDYDHGMDFFLAKKKQGQWANYDDSGWIKPGSLSPRSRPLTESERAAISTHGLWNLSQYMPKKPDEDHLNAIMELFTASVNEELYDADRWGQFYRPNGMRLDNNGDSGEATGRTTVQMAARSVNPAPAPAPAPAVTAASILNRVANKPMAEESVTVPWEEKSSEPVAQAEKPKMQSPEDILAAIRKRQQQK